MKTTHSTKLFLILLALLLPACMDVELTTILKPDGSMERIVEVRSDKEIEDYSQLPFPIDSTWHIVYRHDSTANGKNHIYKFKKAYKNAGELNNDELKVTNALSKFKRTVKVEKKFRWFFTYLVYTESFQRLSDGEYTPFNQLLSEMEKEVRHIDDADTIANLLELDAKKLRGFRDEIQNKSDNWFENNMKREVLLQLEKDIKLAGIKGLGMGDLEPKADTIYKIIDKNGFNGSVETFYRTLNTLFNTNEFNRIIALKKSSLLEMEENVGDVFSIVPFRHHLHMPGLIVDTNAESIKGNELYWQFMPLESYFADTTHYAESRILNVWAFVASAFLVFIAIASLVVSALRKRKRDR
jgi:hypothetical protein